MGQLRRRLLIAAATALCAPLGRAAAASRIELRAIAASGHRYDDALKALERKFGAIPVAEDPANLRRSPRPTAYLALGAAAFQMALQARLEAPVVALFASRQAYELALMRHPDGGPSTAIYGEPDPEHQMRLIAALYQRPIAVGTLLSRDMAHLEPALRDAARRQRLRLEAVHVGAGTGLTRSLNLLELATVLLIQPDSTLYTQASLRELLESTYRRRLPVIGFSSALVAAGTLASAYSSADDIAAQVAVLLEQVAAHRLPPPQYPVYWQVAVNDHVARSLDVVVDGSVRSLGDRP